MFGQERARQAKLKKEEKQRELETTVNTGEEKVREAREKIRQAKEKMENERKGGKKSEEEMKEMERPYQTS